MKKEHKQYLEILKLKKKIIHIHLKDKNFFGQNVIIGKGNVNFTSIFRSLKKLIIKVILFLKLTGERIQLLQ